MRFSTLSSLLCALAVGVIGSTLRAADTPAPAAQCQCNAKATKVTPVKLAPGAPKPAAPPGPVYPGSDLGLKQIPAPPLPFSATKADRLATLLGKYKADQMSPEEYHQQRSAILAEP